MIIFSSSFMKCSYCFMPICQNSLVETSKPAIFPISAGDRLLPADRICFILGTNAWPSSLYFW